LRACQTGLQLENGDFFGGGDDRRVGEGLHLQGAERLEENMVLGVEVFLGKPGVGSAGFEQNFIVRTGGNELLTTTPMTWW